MTTALDIINVTESLGLEARARRISRLITRPELAAMVGVSQEEVNRLECGQPLPPEKTRKLLLALGLLS